MTNKTFSFIDLFAGIGGFRTAIDNLGGECLFSNDIDKYAQQTYLANYGSAGYRFGDIQTIPAEEIPSHDLLVGGFPCQPFSNAGLKIGFNDIRGNLFFQIVRILEHHRPNCFLLENVKSLVNHDQGRTFLVMQKALKQLHYHLQWQVIDARHWVPQKRERVYLVGLKQDTDFSFNKVFLPPLETAPLLQTILEPQVDPKYTLSDVAWAGRLKHAQRHLDKGNGFGYGLFGSNDVARTLTARYYKDGSEILIEQTGQNPRKLTPRECARLMGFSDNFQIVCSDTQAYKQFGNSVVVPVIEAIGTAILPYI